MIPINKCGFTLLLLVFSIAKGNAQRYNYKAPLNTVMQSAFYEINITPQLAAYLKADLADVRITNEQGKWIPHIIKSTQPVFTPNAFTAFPILSNDINDSGKSILILKNDAEKNKPDKADKNISEIVLFIKNASVNRRATISGSNDKTKWFIIAENILIENNYKTAGNYFINSVKFDKIDYSYFKILIDNYKTDPLNIIKAGSYQPPAFAAAVNNFVPNPAPVFTQQDSSNGRSYIKITNREAYHISKLQLIAGGAKFFKRNANIYTARNDGTVNEAKNNSLLSFQISSAGANEFYIKNFKEKYFYVVLENGDNPALQVKNMVTLQQANKIVTFLEKGKQYFIVLDNAAAGKPDYDLETFKDSIPGTMDSIGFGALQNIPLPVVVKSTSHKWWLWPAIILAFIVLGSLSYKLLGEVRRTEK